MKEYLRLSPEERVKTTSGIRITIRVCTFTCNNCGETWKEKFGPLAWLKFKIFGTTCPNCGKKNYNYKTAIDFISVALAIILASVASCWFF